MNSLGLYLSTILLVGYILVGPIQSWPLDAAHKALYGNKLGDIRDRPLDKNGKVTQQGVTPWPNGRVIYTIKKNVFTADEKQLIFDSMKAIANYTSNCITFVPRKKQKNYIEIFSDDGCYSLLGVAGGKQPLSLQKDGCLYNGTIMHEFLHALGFSHEQERPDRDNYVKVFIKNVEKDSQSQYDKVPADTALLFNLKYDYASIMHYGMYAFALPGKIAMQPLKKGVVIKEPYEKYKLTTKDVAMIRKFYNCPTVPS